MPAGRPRKPVEVKIAEGNRSKLGKDKLQPNPHGLGHPTPPNWMRPREFACWKRLIEALPEGVIRRSDDTMVEQLAIYWAQFLDIYDLLNRRDAKGKPVDRDYLVTNNLGKTVTNPLLLVQRQTGFEIQRLCSQLGYSPAARAKLLAQPPVDEDPFDIMGLGKDYDPDKGWILDADPDPTDRAQDAS